MIVQTIGLIVSALVLNLLVSSSKHYNIQNTLEFGEKVRNVFMEADETMFTYDVTSLFTCVPLTEAVEIVRKRLQDDPILHKWTARSAHQVCLLLEQCLPSTFHVQELVLQETWVYHGFPSFTHFGQFIKRDQYIMFISSLYLYS